MENQRVKIEMPDGPRPSLDVAIGVLANLKPRIDSLCQRVLSWDANQASHPTGSKGAALFLSVGARKLLEELTELKKQGFVAKSTSKSRMLAHLDAGGAVSLRDDVRKLYSQHYSAEELDEVKVVGRDGDAAIWVELGHREHALPIPVKLSQLLRKR